ncbi:hypothetical protein GS891_23905 [Rhodococcus hoagii]|nr:hypothetical protein [Prescottella equi]
MWDMVRELVREGTTILLTTQYLDEAEALADRIAVLDEGRIVAEGSADELKRLVPAVMSNCGSRTAHRPRRPPPHCPRRSSTPRRRHSRSPPTAASAPSGGSSPASTTGRCPSNDSPCTPPDLDDVFFALTGSEKKEAVR